MLARAACLAAVACTVGAALTLAAAVPATQRGAKLTAHQRDALARALAEQHERYDPAERMIRRPFSSPGYHTTLKGGMVHPTRDSLRYALACLDTGDGQLLKRAQDVIDRVVALQDQDPASRTYGIWSWFLEEPLAKMSPPDWNWADFCGHLLLQAVIDHRDRLGPELSRRVDESIAHACRSIRRRNVGPGYTNIALLGTYVTLVAAETYGDEDLKGYATARLRRFHEHTKEKGGFSEYNSPTYTMVSLRAIAEMLRDVRDAEARGLLEELHERTWRDIAFHFHAPTRQWAGPHSRSYSTLLRPGTLAAIERGLGGAVDLGDLDGELDLEGYRVPLSCPEPLRARFAARTRMENVYQVFEKAEPPVAGQTFLHPKYAMSSISRGDFWNQRRGLLAYWGTAQKPAYLHVRVLRDGYDFAAAQLACQQYQGLVVAGITFATDGGNTHVSLDRLKDGGTFTARDLRVRFELGGAGAELAPVPPKNVAEPTVLDLGGGLRLRVQAPFARFGDEAPRWEAGKTAGEKGGATTNLDLVLYSGPEKQVRLADLDVAAVGLFVEITDRADRFWVEHGPRTSELLQGKLVVNWACKTVVVPAKPDVRAKLVPAPPGPPPVRYRPGAFQPCSTNL